MKVIDYQKYEKPSDFVKFHEGKNIIQIVSKGILVKRHGMKTAQRYIPLGVCTEDDTCQFCKDGNEPKLKWSWLVYLPETNQIRLLDAGVMIGDQICQLAKSSDPQTYEIIITRTGAGRQTKYQVAKGGAANLTPQIRGMIEPTKEFLFNKYFKEAK